MSLNSGTLWVTATPLGNCGDLSPRAREVLATADGILAEDTRKTGSMLARCGVSTTAVFAAFHDHNEEERLPKVLELLRQGKTLALVSDAGTPLLSDPGFRLVRACRKEGITVSPLPGPSAVTAALSACGLPPQPFVFLGFAPRREAERAAFFAPYARLPVTLVFFDRKDRLKPTLQAAAETLGPREACIARELTKTYEEFLPFSLDALDFLDTELPGEITVVIGPAAGDARDSEAYVAALLAEETAKGGKPREIARRVSRRVIGWSGKEVYELRRNADKNSA